MGAVLLNAREADICINWSGGMHHARCGECSGFCYVNDIVLAILELLKVHSRVLYVDLDIHHGDGVEEAFYTTDRVFTLSLHKFGEMFFPGTGNPLDIGSGKGKFCTMNLSVFDGMNDLHYTRVFSHALAEVVRAYGPNAVVLQCGADSCAGDRVGVLDLSSAGHAACVRQVRDLGLPLLVVGGGGYTVHNVAKLWAYETAVLCGDSSVRSSTEVPLQRMPLTGHLHLTAPLLHVPSDATITTQFGLVAPLAVSKLIAQIDAHVVNIPPPPPGHLHQPGSPISATQ
jgi:histone deacetylase 1/2